MDPIQPLQHLYDLIVFRRAHVLPDEKAVLGRGSPGDARGLGGGHGGQGLVAAEEGEQVEVVVGGVGAGGKVGGGGGDDAGVEGVGWGEFVHVERGCGDGLGCLRRGEVTGL